MARTRPVPMCIACYTEAYAPCPRWRPIWYSDIIVKLLAPNSSPFFCMDIIEFIILR